MDNREAFVKKYTRRIGNRLSLLEHSKTYDCVFLKDKKCLVYEARPRQCRTFPWWPEQLTSKKEWEEEAARCEGINHQGSKLYTLEEIQEELSKN